MNHRKPSLRVTVSNAADHFSSEDSFTMSLIVSRNGSRRVFLTGSTPSVTQPVLRLNLVILRASISESSIPGLMKS